MVNQLIIVEYTDCISAEGWDHCPGYDTKQSDDEVPRTQDP